MTKRADASTLDVVQRVTAELPRMRAAIAPFDGVITERTVHPGSLVGPSTGALLRIEQVSRLRLTVPMPESYVATITRGKKVDFRVTAFPDQTFQGVIARPAHSLEMKTRSMLVELDVTNPKQVLAPGMFAEVQWPVSRAQTSLFVPRTAVVRTSDADVIEVFGDLREGDDVVRRGNDEIRPGARVARTAANR